MSIRRTFASLLTGLVLVAFAAAAAPAPAAPAQATVRIVAPEDDATVQGTTLVVEIEVEGAILGGRTRNGAHVLLKLDDMPPVKCLARRFTFRNVAPGEHRLVAELYREDGTEPEDTTRVRFRTSTRRGPAPPR